MPPKIKPSVKSYLRNPKTNILTNRWKWKHFYISGMSNKDLLREYEGGNPRNKKKILDEINKRGPLKIG